MYLECDKLYPWTLKCFSICGWGKGNGYSFNLYNEQKHHQCKSLFCDPQTGLDITVLHILCSLLFPSIFPKLYDKYIHTTPCFERPGQVLFLSSFYPLCSSSLIWTLSRGSPVPWASASPTGEVAGFSVHFHKLSSVVSSEKRTLTERVELESAAWRAGNPPSGKCSTQAQTAGAREQPPGKTFVHPKVSSVLLPLFLALKQDFLQLYPSVCGSHGGDQDQGGSIRGHSDSGTRDSGSISYTWLHLPWTSAYQCCFLQLDSTMMVEEEVIWGKHSSRI